MPKVVRNHPSHWGCLLGLDGEYVVGLRLTIEGR